MSDITPIRVATYTHCSPSTSFVCSTSAIRFARVVLCRLFGAPRRLSSRGLPGKDSPHLPHHLTTTTMSALFGAICSRIVQTARALPGTFRSGQVGTGPIATHIGSTWSSQLLLQYQPKRFGSAFPNFVNLPPVQRIAGKGNVYETQVSRKRVITDPNKPNFDHIEPLKYTTWSMLRDVRRRHIFVRYHFNQMCLQNMHQSRILPNSVKEAALQESKHGLPKESNFYMLRNRCSISGRTRGNLKKYRLSRLVWRNLADYNKLSGVIKAAW